MRQLSECSVRAIITAVLFAVGAGGCGSKRGAEPAAPPASARQPLTTQEAEHFARSLEDAVTNRDKVAYIEAIDWDSILDSATGGIKGAEETRRGFVANLKQSMPRESFKQISQDGCYRFLRIHRVDNQVRALFRLTSYDGTLNYHDLILMRQADGQIRAVDIHIVMAGETLSKSLRSVFLPIAAAESKSVLGDLTQKAVDYCSHAQRAGAMARHVRDGEPGQALEIYHQLPPSLRKDKVILLGRIAAAAELGPDEYASALKELRACHPDDPCVDILSIDYYLLAKEYDKALACVDHLDESIGGDSYLDVHRADILIEQGDYPAAKALLDKALAAEPSQSDAYQSLDRIALAERDFEETKQAVAALEKLGATVDQKPDGGWNVLIEDIGGTKGVDDSWFVHLTDLKNLTDLQVFDTGITDAGLATLGQLEDLEQLSLRNCSKVSGAGLSHVRGLAKLRFLNLQCGNVGGAGLKHVCGLVKLRFLNLLGTSVDDDSLAYLEGLKQLRSLTLDCTRISDAGLAHLKPLANLEFLHLTAPLLPYEPGRDHHFAPSKIGDAGLAYLAGLSRIRELNLEQTNVTDAGLEQLSGLTRLEILMLDGTKVSLDGLEKLQQSLPRCDIRHPMLKNHVGP